jgi:predicted glycogen debranching enzyme
MDFEKGIQGEWLVANGVGGYSSSTILGCNTRKYHGLLVASLEPPVKRNVLLSKIDEEIIVDGETHQLSTNEYQNALHPRGYENLRSFELNPFPIFTYQILGITVRKKIFSVHGLNAAVITYQISNPAEHDVKFKAEPFITSRGIHFIGNPRAMEFSNGKDEVLAETEETILGIGCYPGNWQPSGFSQSENWYKNFHYRRERERGYPSDEDLYTPGEFLFATKKTAHLNVLVLGGGRSSKDIFPRLFKKKQAYYDSLYEKEKKRIENQLENFHEKTKISNDRFDPLVVAADSFIVERQKPRGRSIIAGYPWFSDFGRDAFIALPGLTLITGRFEDAKKIISTFNEAIIQGLVPNNFSEDGVPHFNGVDASLWFIYAVQKYLEYSGDQAFVKKLLPSLKAVVNGFIRGNNLAAVQEDGLISVSNKPLALTWMDVNIHDQHATPRYGKVVEINALWFNSLRFLGELIEDSEEFDRLATKVQTSFEIFWNPEKNCLFDFIYRDLKDDYIRPNQIFSLSLPYSPLDKKRGRAVVSVVMKELLTPFGLRSLERKSASYRAEYAGDSEHRDLAYHQGTVWSWLLGPFITAYVKVNDRSHKSRLEAESILNPILSHISVAGLGSISEIFDGSPPHKPKGCISQAWSVGEILRAYFEDIKGGSPAEGKKS